MPTEFVYRDRIVEAELARRLGSMGAVVVEGPRASGKTETARRFAASEVLLDVDANARRLVALDPALVLDGETPRLIDEWQIEADIWNHIRRQVDERRRPGQFILTGSAVPSDDITRHSGAGRLARVRMRPMSLYETGHSTGEISFSALLEGAAGRSADALELDEILTRIAVGGWPAHLERAPRQALEANRAYLDEIRRVDIERVDGTRRDPRKVGRLLRSLARNVATCASVATLAADTGGADGSIKDHTALEYLASLERLMVVEDQPAWGPHLRSRSRLREAAKRHYVDPSLAVAALGTTPGRLTEDLKLTGFLFESLAVRDLRVYAQPLEGQVYHYRDNTGLECDAIVELADGRWAAFEVKLGGQSNVEEAAGSLLKLRDRIDTSKAGEPSCLAVIVAVGYGYVRDDGVGVIPIGSLGP